MKKSNLITGLADIHCHMLSNLDDGPAEKETMCAMLRAAYADGIRFLCFTPHYRPDYFHFDAQKAQIHFEFMQQFAKSECPEMKLYLGNEIFCRQTTVSDLQSGKCRTLNQTRYVLVEFYPEEEFNVIRFQLQQLCAAGYQPVLAHVERYRCLYLEGRPAILHREGCVLQGNSNSLTGHDFRARRFLKSLIEQNLLFAVADDCHNLTSLAPGLSKAYFYIAKHYGTEAADTLLIHHPKQILDSDTI